MNAAHLEVLTEERSMERFLESLLPLLLPADSTFSVHSFRGKRDLLKKLRNRLSGYSKWLPENYRIVVVVDRDSDDCKRLKEKLETMAHDAGLLTRTRAGNRSWQIVNRIAIEELEAWYFGDWQAVCQAYPRVSPNVPNQSRYRDPDAIRGGTWEAFERVMKRHGYFRQGLGKVQAAAEIAKHMDPARSRSRSFVTFREAILEAAA